MPRLILQVNPALVLECVGFEDKCIPSIRFQHFQTGKFKSVRIMLVVWLKRTDQCLCVLLLGQIESSPISLSFIQILKIELRHLSRLCWSMTTRSAGQTKPYQRAKRLKELGCSQKPSRMNMKYIRNVTLSRPRCLFLFFVCPPLHVGIIVDCLGSCERERRKNGTGGKKRREPTQKRLK